MPSTSADNPRDPNVLNRGRQARRSDPTHPPRARRRHLTPVFAVTIGCVGCSELVHEGIVSDRETSRPIPGVRIDQNRARGWKDLGETDGKGRYWILKSEIRGGGRIRLSKAGYYATTLSEAEFLGGQSFLMIPGESESDEFRELLRRQKPEDAE